MAAETNSDSHRDPNRDQVLQDFLRTLKVSFKNATIYNTEHPAFVGSVSDLKKNIEIIFKFLSPISISFTPRSLFMDDQFWEGEKIYQELGRLFHFRKIKTLEIRPGITDAELMTFSAKITLTLKDFLKEGGPQAVIKKENLRHIHVEELDYTQLLKGEGGEISDIWAYLMEEGLEEQDSQKLVQVTENFEHIIGKFNTDELIVNEELQQTFSKYFKYLKGSSDNQYRKCAKSLVKAVVTNRKITTESKFENLKLLISDLREEDLAHSVWEEIIVDNKFDSISFSIFSKLIEKERHLEISTSLRDLFQSDDPVNRQPEVEEKIKALLSGTSSKFISEIYKQTLGNLLKEINFDQKLTFERTHLNRNYWYVLLNMLEREKHIDQMLVNIDKIQAEWKEITSSQDFTFAQNLWEVLKQKEDSLLAEEQYKTLVQKISEFIESTILDENTNPVLEFFLQNLQESIFNTNIYLDSIFTKEKVSPFILQAFFKFFSNYLFYFNLNLEQKGSKPVFFIKMIKALESIDTPMSLVTLKTIYPLGERPVKVRVLQAMQKLSNVDEKFLFQVLRSKESDLKGLALTLLLQNPKTRNLALDKLLNIQSPFGVKNKLVNKHIGIMRERKLYQAKEHLIELTKRSGFWNRRVRAEARKVLEDWDAG